MISRLHKNFPTSLRKYQQIQHRLLGTTKFVKDATRVVPEIVKLPEFKYLPGKEYHGFTCRRAETVPEFSLTAYTFQHNKIGCEYWHIDRNDRNNVFSINFRTTPFDSTGLPHILEHSVLCGSEKFPVRDPFFKMLTRSVATFMNAMTGPDYTLYPFSSMNEVDYRNLQGIYLDAVFKPNLKYLDFLQEGWRLEHSDLKDKKSEYVLKGVVYNEMKGAFSENSSIFGEELLNNILPDHTYGFVSGGNPLDIPKLTHKDLVEFHRKYYHPSNSRFFSYGTFDLEKSLAYVNETYLQNYECIDNSYSRIPSQPRWQEPRHVHTSSRFDNMGAPFERQNQIAIGLLLSDITNIYETFELHVITELLIRGPNSPFYKTLIEPNFSGGYNKATGYTAHLKDTLFSIGLQDLKVDEFSRVQEIFDKTFDQVVREGFQKDHIESVLHNIELSLKHQTPQFGLGILLNMTPLWNHEGDIIEGLKVSSLIGTLRENLAKDPQYLQKKIEFYFKNNNHRLTLTMSPDENYENKFKDAEQKIILDKVSQMTQEEKEKIYENGLALDEAQKAPPNIDVLPILSLDDVKTPPEPYNIKVFNTNNVPTQLCTVPTNQIAYFKGIFSATKLTPDQINLIPLFCNVINEMGTKNYDFRSLDTMITSKTSGIDFKLHFAENIYDNSKYDLGVMMSTHALDYNIPKMFELCEEILVNFKVDDMERLKMLLENYVSAIAVGITDSGHLYAMQSCSGLVTEAAKLKSLLSGVEHIEFMKDLSNNYKIEDIAERLIDLGKSLFDVGALKTAINCSEEMVPLAMEQYEKFLTRLPNSNLETNIKDATLLTPSCSHFVMNIPVNYCAKAFLSVPYTHEDHPVLRVFAKLISAKYLLPVVREQNGAYGAGAKIGPDGIFNFFSYRDPNSRQTLDVFDNTYQWFTEYSKTIDEQLLFEAKLGVLQQLDAPVAPGNKGIDNLLYGVSQELFQKYRQRTLNVTVEQLNKVAERYFKKEPRHYGKCVLGPENKKLLKSGEKWATFCQ